VRNPADAADPPSAPPSRVESWTAKELSRFLAHVGEDRLFALWRLGATTGMRRGELAGLMWRWLDLDGARLSVEQQLAPTRGGLSFGPPKSSRSRRTVALDAETVEFLRQHRDVQLAERAFAGEAYLDFGKLRKAAGLPTGTLHVLRHTAATLALTNGVPVHIVAARLGDDPKTILSTYAHLLPQSDEMAASRIAAAVSGSTVL
jgi:integrase